jgi:hypothetical protein
MDVCLPHKIDPRRKEEGDQKTPILVCLDVPEWMALFAPHKRDSGRPPVLSISGAGLTSTPCPRAFT